MRRSKNKIPESFFSSILLKRYSETIQLIYGNVISVKLLFDFIEITPHPRGFSPVNLLYICRTAV